MRHAGQSTLKQPSRPRYTGLLMALISLTRDVGSRCLAKSPGPSIPPSWSMVALQGNDITKHCLEVLCPGRGDAVHATTRVSGSKA